MTPKMKKRGAWPGIEDPNKQALIDVEKNAADAVDALAKSGKPAWNPVTTSSNYQAQLWDLVIARAGCTILLPAASPSNIGAEIAVLKVGSITISVTPISGLVNNMNSDAGPSANRTRTYVSCGEGWFSLA